MNDILLKHTDSSRQGSIAANLRKKRLSYFIGFLSSIEKKKIEILDVGGTVSFWQNTEPIFKEQDKDVHITILNLKPQHSEHGFITAVTGDACDLSIFKEKQFDIVFSNSVIEHLGTWDSQKRMANEVRRVGIYYFVQTPNRYFLIEPHFIFPFFQFLPLALKVFLTRHFNLGWYKNIGSKEDAIKAIRKIRLLNFKEFKSLFPEAQIYKEKFFGLIKSFIAYKFYV